MWDVYEAYAIVFGSQNGCNMYEDYTMLSVSEADVNYC